MGRVHKTIVFIIFEEKLHPCQKPGSITKNIGKLIGVARNPVSQVSISARCEMHPRNFKQILIR
jgi:hypothetical protein